MRKTHCSQFHFKTSCIVFIFAIGLISCSESDPQVVEFNQQIIAIQGYPRHIDLSELLETSSPDNISIEIEPTNGTLTFNDQVSGHWTTGLYQSNAVNGFDEVIIQATDQDNNVIARKRIEITIQAVPLRNTPYGQCQGSLYNSSRIKQDSVLTIDLMDNEILCNIGTPVAAFFEYFPKENYKGIAFYISKENQIMLYQAPENFFGKLEFDYEICYIFSEEVLAEYHNQNNAFDNEPASYCQTLIQASAVIEVLE